MTDDPDELRYELEAEKKDPVRQIAALRETLDEIEIHLRYGLPRLKLIGWLIALLLGLILWRVWRQ
jgi:hypothetical protein